MKSILRKESGFARDLRHSRIGVRNSAVHERSPVHEAANQSIGRRLSFGRVSRKPSSTMSAAPPSTTVFTI